MTYLSTVSVPKLFYVVLQVAFGDFTGVLYFFVKGLFDNL